MLISHHIWASLKKTDPTKSNCVEKHTYKIPRFIGNFISVVLKALISNTDWTVSMIAELWNIHAKEKTTYTPRERQLQVSKIKYKTVFFFHDSQSRATLRSSSLVLLALLSSQLIIKGKKPAAQTSTTESLHVKCLLKGHRGKICILQFSSFPPK